MNSAEARKKFTEWMNDPAAEDAITKEGSIDASWIGFWEGWKSALVAAPTPPAQPHQLDDADIRAIALDCGFKLKPQPDGLEDLNPYVYRFAREILSTIPRAEDVEVLRQRLTPPAQDDEPVAYRWKFTGYPWTYQATPVDAQPGKVIEPLYARPDNNMRRGK